MSSITNVTIRFYIFKLVESVFKTLTLTLLLQPNTMFNNSHLGLAALLFLSFSFLPLKIFCQNDIQLGIPLDIPIALSGNFAELRSGHFHAGLDIKTKGRQGLPVKAVASGSIRRIRVSTKGYGKSIYIEHNNGLTTVYAHLQKFAPKIEALIRKYQYEKESFEVQKFLKKGELTVNKGERIGLSGNTGGSFGPHLHYEVRDSDSQRPINPLRMGIPVEDSQRPQLQELHLFDGNENLFRSVALQKVNDSLYKTELIETGGTIGLGLSMFDRQDRSYNRNGIFSVSLYLNGQERYHYQFDQFDFRDGQYIPLFIDYGLYVSKKKRLYKLFTPQASQMSFLAHSPSTGQLGIESGKSYQIKIKVSDFHGNQAFIESYWNGIVRDNPVTNEDWSGAESILPDKDYLFDFDGKGVYIPKKSIFRSTQLQLFPENDQLGIRIPDIPIRKAWEVYLAPPQLDSLAQQQTAIVQLAEDGEKIFLPTQKKEDQWTVKTKKKGIYTFARDSIFPSVQATNFKDQQWLSKYRYLKVAIEDKESGIQSYHGSINGRWIRFEYEPKNKTLTYDFQDLTFKNAKHELRLEVTDGVGNTTVKEWTFFRKYNLNE